MSTTQVTELLEKADRSYQRGRLEEALDAYQRVLELDDSIAWAYSRMGAILAQRGDLDGAEENLQKAIERDPTLPQAHSNLGNIYYNRGDYEAALNKYKQASALDPDNPLYHENIHAAYRKMGKITEAVAALKHAHRLMRIEAKEEAKTRLSQVRSRTRGRPGCLGTLTLFLILTAGFVCLLS